MFAAVADPASSDSALRLSATAHGVNYLPEYYAHAKGLFDQVGLTVESRVRDPWTGVLDDLESGAADVALGGLWVPAMFAGSGRELVAVGQLNARFPMVVLTREPLADFEWSSLSRRTVLVPGAGGTAPYEFTAGLIRESGTMLEGTRLVRDLSGQMLTELWRAGLGDAYVTDLLTGLTLQAEGRGAIAVRLAELGGLMPNSVYYVKAERLAELRDRLVEFMSVITASMRALDGRDDLEAAFAVATANWPGTPESVIRKAITELSANGTWSSSVIDPEAAARWIRILDEAGLLFSSVTVAQIVDDSIAAAV